MFERPARVSLITSLYKLRYWSRFVLHNGTWDRKNRKTKEFWFAVCSCGAYSNHPTRAHGPKFERFFLQ